MRNLRGTSASFTTVVSLGMLYVTVVLLTVVLSRELLRGPEPFQIQYTILFAVLGLLFVVVLLALVAVNVVRLLRERRRGVPGSTLKSRMSLFFAMVVLLSAVPQGVVSVSFLSSAMDLLFSSGTGTALGDGLRLSLLFYDRQEQQLEQVVADGTLVRVFGDMPDDPDATDALRAWTVLENRLPDLAAMQLVDADGNDLLFQGVERLRRSVPGSRVTGTDLVVSRLSVGGEGMLRLVAPVPERPGLTAVITTALPAGFENAARNLTEARRTFEQLEQLRPAFMLYMGLVYGVFAAPILLLAVLASFFLSARIMRPIESLEDATRRVAEGDYSVRILGRPSDDLGLLVISFNNMVTDLDRARRRMIQAEKVQAWQEIAQRLAHEVKNPLTPIRLAAERLRRRYEADAEDFGNVLNRTVDTIIREVDALASLLDDFRSFARMPRPARENALIRDIVREAAAVYREDPRVTIDTAGVESEMIVSVDRGQMRQVIGNLVANATEAAGDRVAIRFKADLVRKNNVPYCRLRVEDDGPGIPEDLGKTIFEPYITSKGEGTGLGLAIVERIVFDHDGQISFESAPGSGTTFIIDLPAYEEGPGES